MTEPEPVQSSGEHRIDHVHDHIQVERGKGDADSVLDASVQIAINVSFVLTRQRMVELALRNSAVLNASAFVMQKQKLMWHRPFQGYII